MKCKCSQILHRAVIYQKEKVITWPERKEKLVYFQQHPTAPFSVVTRPDQAEWGRLRAYGLDTFLEILGTASISDQQQPNGLRQVFDGESEAGQFTC